MRFGVPLTLAQLAVSVAYVLVLLGLQTVSDKTKVLFLVYAVRASVDI